MSTLTVTRQIHFATRSRGRKEVVEGARPAAIDTPEGRAPRLMRLMALAYRLDGLIESGVITDQSQAAAMGQVTRARMTQILGLMRLAPDIRLAILQLPRTRQARDRLSERQIRALTLVVDWEEQRKVWKTISRHHRLP